METSNYLEKHNSYFELNRAEMLPFVVKSASFILEFGCGNGAFGRLVKQEINCFYEGVEPVVVHAENAIKSLDKVNFATVEDFISQYKCLGVKKYDVIVFNDVLEHLNDPFSVLKNIKEFLLDDGTIVASIPNFLNYNSLVQILSSKDFKYEESGILDKTHLRFFTKKSIIRMFREAGFEIVQIKGINKTVNSLKFKMLNFLSFNYFEEFKYLQFAIVAKAI